jgi:hypothetical protein
MEAPPAKRSYFLSKRWLERGEPELGDEGKGAEQIFEEAFAALHADALYTDLPKITIIINRKIYLLSRTANTLPSRYQTLRKI